MKPIVLFFLFIVFSAITHGQKNDWNDVESILGKKGTMQDNVFKLTFPRSDLDIKVGDFSVSAGLAFTTWIAFMTMDNQTTMMGDLVVLDKEVGPVISEMIAQGLQITALHNHIIGEVPAVKYIHYSGSGNASSLASKIKILLGLTGTPLTTTQEQIVETPDWSKVEDILGKTGKKNGVLLQYSFPRNEKLTESGMEMPPFIGMATVLNFQSAGDRAATTGDFVLLADEVNPVIKALTKNGILVTAIHNHMLYDNPRLFMLHFWAVADPVKLATGLKEALDKTNSKK